MMSLDVYLTKQPTEPEEVYWRNITHNLGTMAVKSGLYDYLWAPEDIGITKASELIQPLETGLALLESDPERFKEFNPPNGWGKYENLVEFVRDYLAACRENPDADVRVSR